MASTGIILTTYGEPERNSFAAQWMYSYRILERLTRRIAPIPRALLPVIATARAHGRVRLWARNRFQSPLEPLHDQMVLRLAETLERRAAGLLVTRAYEFRRPSMADALVELEEHGREKALVVPMYIAGGDFTHGMTRIALGDALRRRPEWSGGRVEICWLSEGDADRHRLAGTLARHFLDELAGRGISAPARDWALLLAAHGTVINPPPGVDNGLRQFGGVLLDLKRLLRPHVGLVRIGWLNHTRGGKWTTPAVPDALRRIQERGYRKLIYFPWGFTTDNAETALEGRVALDELEQPFERLEYLPCLNSSESLVNLLADRVCQRLDARAPGDIPAAPAPAVA